MNETTVRSLLKKSLISIPFGARVFWDVCFAKLQTTIVYTVQIQIHLMGMILNSTRFGISK